jgi:hypothetical protein
MRLVGQGLAALKMVGTADKLTVYRPVRPAGPRNAGSLHGTGNRFGGATASGQGVFPTRPNTPLWEVGAAPGARADNLTGVSAVRPSLPKTWIGVGMV